MGNSVSVSNYSNCLNNCILKRPWYNPHVNSSTDHLHTGAFPIRWWKRENANDVGSLSNGLLLNTQYLASGMGTYLPQPVYKITSGISHTYETGWIRLDMRIFSFMREWPATSESDKVHFYDSYTQAKIPTSFFFTLKIGTKMWNGSAWVTTGGTLEKFNIPITGAGEVDTNKTDDMMAQESGGWWIPITERLTGVVELQILNYCALGYPNDMLTQAPDQHSHILCDLDIHHVAKVTMAESTRTTNTYYRETADSGFKGKKEKTLSIGTKNNNPDSVLFLRSSSTYSDYLEWLQYNDASRKRPEVHLLERMMQYHIKSRQIVSGIVATGEDFVTKRWEYDDKLFVGLDATHEWREDRQKVKFIECIKSDEND